jgi:hypothetical protein
MESNWCESSPVNAAADRPVVSLAPAWGDRRGEAFRNGSVCEGGGAENERSANREMALMFPIVTSVWTATESASSSATVGIISTYGTRLR